MAGKIRDALPIPTQCDCCCSSNIEFTSNAAIYGKEFGPWPFCYVCKDCGASVGAHNSTNIPLGRMADRATKALRKKAHDEFDLLWKTELLSRTKAYNWLARQLGIAQCECHISWLTKEQLIQTAELARKHIAENAHVLRRRRIKDDARQAKRNQRNANTVKRYRKNR